MNKNREIVEAFGGCWHIFYIKESGYFGCRKCDEIFWTTRFPDHPDFTTDAGKVQLLRELSKREDWYLFVHEIGKCNSGHFYSDYVEIDYITDTTGKLRDQAIKWLREEATDECNG